MVGSDMRVRTTHFCRINLRDEGEEYGTAALPVAKESIVVRNAWSCV